MPGPYEQREGTRSLVKPWLFHMKEKVCGEPWALVRMSGKHPCQEERCWNGECLRTKSAGREPYFSLAVCVTWCSQENKATPMHSTRLIAGSGVWEMPVIVQSCSEWYSLEAELSPATTSPLKVICVWRSILMAIGRESLGDGQADP